MLLYIDPGAGSLVIQAIIAAIVAVPFFFRNSLRSLVGKVRRGGHEQSEQTGADKATD